jgi:hypothetical protein
MVQVLYLYTIFGTDGATIIPIERIPDDIADIACHGRTSVTAL